MVFWFKVMAAALAGAWGAALTNRGIAVYHDGLRAIIPELTRGHMQPAEATSIAFGLSFGLLVGFGIPFSLISGILLIHTLWLGTDLIGIRFSRPVSEVSGKDQRNYRGLASAAFLGALYGAGLVLGMQAVTGLSTRLPVKVFEMAALFNTPIVFTFAAFPAIAVAYQYGLKHGLVTFSLILLAQQAARLFMLGNPNGWALAAGILAFVFYALRDSQSSTPDKDSAEIILNRAGQVRKNLPVIAVLGAVYSLVVYLLVFMEGPQSLGALALGDRSTAILISLARALSFTPLKAMSSLTSGVFVMDGLGFVATSGLAAPNILVAIIAGAAVMSLEALGLAQLARILMRYPVLLRAADCIRTAMTKLLEIAALVGAMLVANRLAPGFGFIFVAGLYGLNEAAGAPLVRAALGPVALLLVGIAVNILALI